MSATSHMARTKNTARKVTGDRASRVSLNDLEKKEKRLRDSNYSSRLTKKKPVSQKGNLVSILYYLSAHSHNFYSTVSCVGMGVPCGSVMK